MKTLLLKLAGPMQAWGTSSDFEIRHTDLYPSKSAVIGMIAACLGYKRNDDEKISDLNNLEFAVRIDQKGNMMRDFHIAKSYKPDGTFIRTYVTNRYYIEDAVFVVALGSKDGDLIEELSLAFKNMYFQPFMGRRSLPLNADFYLGLVEDDTLSAIIKTPWQAASWYKCTKGEDVTIEIYADSKLLKDNGRHLRRDKIISFSQKNRSFEYRYESKDVIKMHNIFFVEKHDAFAAIGDEDVFV